MLALQTSEVIGAAAGSGHDAERRPILAGEGVQRGFCIKKASMELLVVCGQTSGAICEQCVRNMTALPRSFE
jgi:hypothetical protein